MRYGKREFMFMINIIGFFDICFIRIWIEGDVLEEDIFFEGNLGI